MPERTASSISTAGSQREGSREEGIGYQERERRRWARELHDETLQGLVGLQMLLGAARQQPNPTQLFDAVDTALEMVSDEIQKLRHLIIELRPAELDAIGLEAAIQKLAARVATLGGPKVITDVALEYESGTSRTRLSSDIETTVYRIIQESLSNAVQHAGARSVHVHVTDVSGQVEARVSDDGRGFQESTEAEGFGLAGMRERAALAGATLSVRTSTSGTTIEFVCPVARTRSG